MTKCQKIAVILFAALFCFSISAFAGKEDDAAKNEAVQWLDANAKQFNDAAEAIFNYAETAFKETKSSAYLADLLEKNGFTVERGVAGIPTAFVASYGSGKPVIGILAEYDALPGLSQKGGVPKQDPIDPEQPGHGCGHNLFGAGSAAGAVALKTVMEKHNLKGTVKLFGCPAEETLAGKIYMARDGVFDGLDVCLNWHPGSSNSIHVGSNNAMNNFEVTFHGRTAHAGAAPQSGRSALDAVELMDAGVNFLREHVRDSVRIHYVITDGGMAPNIVPERASVWYFVRDVDRAGVDEVYNRVLKCAEGASLMTETTYDVKFYAGSYNYIPNVALSEVMYENLTKLGPVQFTESEQQFAKDMQTYLGREATGMSAKITPFERNGGTSRASSDASDVSWIVPTTGELTTATNPPGAPGHSWAVVSSSGCSAGYKGMIHAGKVIAMTGIDILYKPSIVEKAQAEFREKTGGKPYKSPLPEGTKAPLPEK